jgi:hypothetical protein
MQAVRILIHSLVFLLVGLAMQFLAVRTRNEGLAFLVSLIQWSYFFPFAIAGSCAMHQNKACIIAITFITILLGQPGSLQELSTQLSTIGVGLLAGTGARNLIIPERKKHGTPKPE